jgi:prephenate dehydrogenase
MPEGSFPAELSSVAIVGAGQVGTMVGMALREAGAPDVSLFDRDPGVAQESIGRGAGDRSLADAGQALRADTLVLALPVPAIVSFLDDLGPSFRAGSFVIDTGSAKGRVVEAIRRSVPQGVHAIGGHPIAGTERPGPAGARPRLLQEAPFILTPARPDEVALARGEALARALGSRPLVLEAEAHDRLIARTSHLSHVLAFALAFVAGDAVREGERLRAIEGPGFTGATRLSSSDPGMVAGFLTANAEEVHRAIEDLHRALYAVSAAIDGGEHQLAKALAAARDALERSR